MLTTLVYQGNDWPDGHVAEEGDVEGGGHVEDVVRDDDLGSCVDIGEG